MEFRLYFQAQIWLFPLLWLIVSVTFCVLLLVLRKPSLMYLSSIPGHVFLALV